MKNGTQVSTFFLIYIVNVCVAAIGGCANSDTGANSEDADRKDGSSQDVGADVSSAADSAIVDSAVADTSANNDRDTSLSDASEEAREGAADASVQDASLALDGEIGGANAAIHDDFESGNLAKWTVTDPFGSAVPANESVAIDTASTGHVHGGMYSVKVHNGGLIGVAPPAPSFYGRFWVWLGSNPSPGRASGGHWAWAVAPGTLPDGGAPEVRQGGQFDILIDNYSSNDDIVLSDPNVFNDTDGGVTPTVGQWLCVEFFFGRDSLRTWLQGTEISTLDVTPTTVWAHGMTAPWSPAYSAIRIGFAGYNGNMIDLWVDDVAIDGSSRIGCN